MRSPIRDEPRPIELPEKVGFERSRCSTVFYRCDHDSEGCVDRRRIGADRIYIVHFTRN